MDLAWDRRISSIVNSQLTDLIDPEGDSLKRRRFSDLHFAALGLLGANVETVLNWTPDDVNVLDADSRTALYWAVRRGDLYATKTLLAAGVDVHAGVSALAWTCKDPCESPELLNILLESGADPNGHDTDGHTALHACGIFGRSVEFLDALVRYNATIDYPYSGPYLQYNGVTPLAFAVIYGHSATLSHLLEYGAAVNVVDQEGQSPAHLTLRSSRKEAKAECLSLLINFGVDVNVRDKRGYTAANTAMGLQDVDSLNMLIKAGADLSPPLSRGGNSSAYSILLWPLIERKFHVVNFLLQKINILEKDAETGCTVLHALSQYGNAKSLVTFEELLSSIPDISVFSADPAQYIVNSELQDKSRFSSLMYRITERQGMDSLLPKSVTGENPLLTIGSAYTHSYYPTVSRTEEIVDPGETEFIDALEYPSGTRATEENIDSQFVPPSMALNPDISSIIPTSSPEIHIEALNTPQAGSATYNAPLIGSEDIDEGVGVPQDPDDELFLAGWHTENVFASNKDFSDDIDSGYASDSSDFVSVPLLPRTPMNMDRINFELWEWKQGKPEEPHEEMKTTQGVKIEVKKNDNESIEDDFTALEERETRSQAPPLPYSSMITGFLLHTVVVLFASLVVAWQHLKCSKKMFKKACRAYMRPKLPAGHGRITWECWCGKEVYADFPNAPPEMLESLQKALHTRPALQEESVSSSYRSATAGANTVTSNNTLVTLSQGTNTNLQSPAAAHVRPSPQNTGNQQQLPSNMPTITTQNPTNASASLTLVPKFLELCINTGKRCQSLGEIDLTRVTSDAVLFAWVRRRYKEVRGPRRHWTQYLIKPVAMKFVSFGLENKTKVHIFAANKYPSEQHVASHKWHYAPCPLDSELPMPSSAFIHYLCYCSGDDLGTRSRSRVWLDRLPKKLIESLMRTSDPLAHAFGLHIIEGPDRTAVLWTLFVVLTLCSGPLIAYLIKTMDVQGTTGLGGMLVAVLTLLWMAAKVSEQGEG